jgi:hypothetical protein
MSFQNIIFKLSEYKKEALKTCHYRSDTDYFLLNKEHINTCCDASSFQIDKSSDVIRLNSCDTNIVGENNLNYKVEQNKNFNSDYILNNDVEKASEIPIKNLILFSVCALLVFILLMQIVLFVCSNSNSNYLFQIRMLLLVSLWLSNHWSFKENLLIRKIT